MRLLLDSDTCIESLRGRQRVVAALLALPADTLLAISIITIAELYYGAARSSRPFQNAIALLQFLHRVPGLPIDERVAARFGILKADLRASGQLIPDFDLLIAATALVDGRTLVTHNTRHFSRIPGLVLVDWLAP